MADSAGLDREVIHSSPDLPFGRLVTNEVLFRQLISAAFTSQLLFDPTPPLDSISPAWSENYIDWNPHGDPPSYLEYGTDIFGTSQFLEPWPVDRFEPTFSNLFSPRFGDETLDISFGMFADPPPPSYYDLLGGSYMPPILNELCVV